jgi:hypothetical protein
MHLDGTRIELLLWEANKLCRAMAKFTAIENLPLFYADHANVVWAEVATVIGGLTRQCHRLRT